MAGSISSLAATGAGTQVMQTRSGASTFGRCVMEGGDLVQVLVDHGRLRGLTPFISYRLNGLAACPARILRHFDIEREHFAILT